MPESLDGSALRRNAGANITGRMITAVLWVAVTPLALDHLGVVGFGVWSLFFALTGSAGVLDLGAANGAARFVALGLGRADPGYVRLAVRRALLLATALGLAWGTIFVLVRFPIMALLNIPAEVQEATATAMLFLGLWMAIFAPAQALQGVLMGFQRLDLSNLALVVGVVVHVGALAFLLSMGRGLVGASIAAVVGHVAALLAGVVCVTVSMRTVERTRPAQALSWGEFIRFGAAVQATNGFIMGQMQAPKLALAVLGQIAWVGVFELAMRVAMTLWSIPTLVQGAVIPAAARASAHDAVDPLRSIYEWACRWIYAAAALLLGGLWVAAPGVFVLWLGPDQVDVAHIARLLALAFGAGILAGPATAVARGGGRPIFETFNFGIALLVQVGLAIVLVPRIGVAGAAVALGLSFLVAAAWLLHRYHPTLGVSTRAWFTRLLVPRYGGAVIAAVVTWWLAGGMPVASRGEAMIALAVQGVVYTLAFLAVTWRTGDVKSVIARVRASMGEGH